MRLNGEVTQHCVTSFDENSLHQVKNNLAGKFPQGPNGTKPMTCSAATQTIVDGNTVRIRGRIVGRDPTALITTASIQGANLTRYLVNLTTGAVVNTATLAKTAVILNAPLSGEGWDTDLGASYNLDDTITGTLLAVTATTSMQVVYEWIDAAGHQVRLKTDPFTVSNLVV